MMVRRQPKQSKGKTTAPSFCGPYLPLSYLPIQTLSTTPPLSYLSTYTDPIYLCYLPTCYWVVRRYQSLPWEPVLWPSNVDLGHRRWDRSPSFFLPLLLLPDETTMMGEGMTLGLLYVYIERDRMTSVIWVDGWMDGWRSVINAGHGGSTYLPTYLPLGGGEGGGPSDGSLSCHMMMIDR